MPVDHHQYGLKSRLEGDGVVVLDRVALRKTWARRGQVSYWVDLLHHPGPSEPLWQVVKMWRWYDKSKSEWVEGSKGAGRPSSSPLEVATTFQDIVGAKLQDEYVIDERQSTEASPAHQIAFQAVPARSAERSEKKPERPAEEPMIRKPKFDVW